MVLNGYENFRELLVKNADYTSSRSAMNTLSKGDQEIVKKTPGMSTKIFLIFKKFCDQKLFWVISSVILS